MIEEKIPQCFLARRKNRYVAIEKLQLVFIVFNSDLLQSKDTTSISELVIVTSLQIKVRNPYRILDDIEITNDTANKHCWLIWLKDLSETIVIACFAAN